MPEVNKVRQPGRAIPTTKPRTDHVSSPAPSVSDGDEWRLGMKCNFFGAGKTGKTRLACTFPKPLLLIGTEDGTLSVRNLGQSGMREVPDLALASGTKVFDLVLRDKTLGVHFCLVKRFEEFEELRTRTGYNTKVLDHVTGFQDIAIREFDGQEPDAVVKRVRATREGRQEWGLINANLQDQLRAFLNLADLDGTNIVILGHEKTKTAEDTGESSDIIRPTVNNALTPGVVTWLNGACHYIGQTFIRPQIVKQKTQMDDGTEVELETRTGKVEYCLRLANNGVVYTGFRVPPGIELPDTLPNPTFERLLQVINGERIE